MHHQIPVAFVLALAASSIFADDSCRAEFERGQREMGTWAEQIGIFEGTIYGYSLMLKSANICLTGTPKERVKAIAGALGSETFRQSPVLLEDVPSEQEAAAFLERFFPCNAATPNPSIERTSSSGLRPLPAAAHVKR